MLACQRVSNPEAILIAEAFEGADSEVTDTPIAEFIAHARTDVPRLVAALRAVEALTYASDDGSDFEHSEGCDGQSECDACWAADIRAAIRDALEAR